MSQNPTAPVSSSPRRPADPVAFQIYAITSYASGTATLTFLISALIQSRWQLFLLSGALGLLTVICGFLYTRLLQTSRTGGILSYMGTTYFALIVVSMTIANTAPLIAAFILLHALLVSSSTLSHRINQGLVFGVIASALAAFIGLFSPIQQIVTVGAPTLDILFVGIVAMMYILVLALLTARYLTLSLSIKLIASSISIAIIPLVLVSAIQSRFTQNALQSQTNQALQLAASETANRVDEFIRTNHQAIIKQAELPVFVNYLLINPANRAGSQQERELKLTLDSFIAQGNTYLSSYGLLNIDGKNIFDTNPLEVGTDEENTDYFIQTVTKGQVYVSPVIFSSSNNDPYIYFAAPIRDPRQQIIGVLRMRYDAFVLQSIINESANLIGKRSYPILLDKNSMRLADALTPNLIYRTMVELPSETVQSLQSKHFLPNLPQEQLSSNQKQFQSAINNYTTDPFFSVLPLPNDNKHSMFGTVVPLGNQGWYMVFLKEQSELRSLLQNQSNISSLIATLISTIVALLATVFANAISNPILQLKNTADQISNGDISAQATVQSNDEIGALGQAFNLMTQQLRDSIYDLEDRVRERTVEIVKQNETLRHRSQQLLTVSDVAREIVSAQELSSLLEEVVNLISERFQFYHVGIFLLDEKKEYALLRAANSAGGKRMLARGHKLKVGEIGIVGYATGTGTPRIATDVGQDATYFNNPDLPQTRSEMALPLKVGDEIIGALDVQSTESNAFTEEDINLFTTLADQVAIAILNNRLFTETAKALEEAQNLHRQYLNQEWQRETAQRQQTGILFTSDSITANSTITPAMQNAMQTGQIITQTENDAAILAIPITLRGTSIGVIQLQRNEATNQEWNENEIATTQAVADHVGQALENARLFEQTIRRADRERRALEITNKIRSTNDPQQMIQIAIQELQQSLHTSRAQILIHSSTNQSESNLQHSEEPETSSGQGATP
jgi:GAF domain-containing protein/HAMP domain-containing protein